MDQPIAKGKALVAMPSLLDPNFRQSVVVLCEHGPEGSMGLIVNRPTEVEVSALINDFPVLSRAGRIFTGGPVARNALLVLCRGITDPVGHDVFEDVFLAKDLGIFKNPGDWVQNRTIRCYLGYAGWGPGQLESELKGGAWTLIPGSPGLIFDHDTTLLWQEMMRRLGGPCSVYASMPPDPSAN